MCINYAIMSIKLCNNVYQITILWTRQNRSIGLQTICKGLLCLPCAISYRCAAVPSEPSLYLQPFSRFGLKTRDHAHTHRHTPRVILYSVPCNVLTDNDGIWNWGCVDTGIWVAKFSKEMHTTSPVPGTIVISWFPSSWSRRSYLATWRAAISSLTLRWTDHVFFQ